MPIRHSTFRWGLILGLFAVWLGFAAWQWHEFGHEREQADDSLGRQCKTAHHLLVSSIVSHRRMGPSFDTMVQNSLEEIVKSKEILAVGIVDRDPGEGGGQSLLLAAGDVPSLDSAQPAGSSLFRWKGEFSLNSTFGMGGGGGGGLGAGYGRGRGRGQMESEVDFSRFQPGHTYTTIFVLDRSDTDSRLHKAYWLRIWLVVTAGLILLLLALAWLVTVRLMEVQSRERILQSEAEHLREMGQAAAGLAHETRNPLGLVRGWTQRLAHSAASSPEVQDQSQAVIEECDRITARINQFLSFAKPCTPKPEPVDLDDLVKELTIILEPDLEAKQLKIDYRTGGSMISPQVDREMFRQALFNLVSNAIAFSPQEGVIEISSIQGNDGKVRMEVGDQGSGVSGDSVASLFTPYYTTREGGTGLGLAIVRRIARAHAWQAGYRPRPGGGSIFWLAETND